MDGALDRLLADQVAEQPADGALDRFLAEQVAEQSAEQSAERLAQRATATLNIGRVLVSIHIDSRPYR